MTRRSHHSALAGLLGFAPLRRTPTGGWPVGAAATAVPAWARWAGADGLALRGKVPYPPFH
ncbi:hypothetical protein ACFWAX_25845, partial [Streptomyces sp. NPDC059956]|uniref:hypothetical protein n=1 Tax=Streptomyces sp. NPDC059956 TaxID=3347015 RepID=UPI003658E349